MKIGVVDYNAGNLRSVETALRHLSADFLISSKPEELLKADKLIFPGVGHAASAMENLSSTGLGAMIKEFFKTGRPILGICLGSQIILEYSEEGPAVCLGLIPGRCRIFPQKGLKVPHMGWNTVRLLHPHPLFAGIDPQSSFYFVHSYYTEPALPPTALAETEYGITFVSALSWNNLTAFQFHPEKSGVPGLRLLANFIEGRE